MLTGPTSKAKVRGKNWMLMGRMRSATMRHAICTVSGHTSQVTCLARTHGDVFRFSSLVKHNKKAKNYAVFCFARFFF
jgi:hypothetical protein